MFTMHQCRSSSRSKGSLSSSISKKKIERERERLFRNNNPPPFLFPKKEEEGRIYKEKDRFRRNFRHAKKKEEKDISRRRRKRESRLYRKDRGVLKILSHSLTLSLSGREGSPAVSRDNWDTVYYRLRAIVALCVIG